MENHIDPVSSLLYNQHHYHVPHLFFLAASSLILPATSKNLLNQPYFQVSGPASFQTDRTGPACSSCRPGLATFKQLLYKPYKQSPNPSCLLAARSLPSLPPPPPTYFPPCLTTLYGPTDWKAAAWNLEGGNVHSVLYDLDQLMQ